MRSALLPKQTRTSLVVTLKGLSASGSKSNSLKNYRLSTSWCLFEVFFEMFFSFFWQSVVSQSPCLCGFRWVQDSRNWQKWPCTSARDVKKWVFCAGSTTFLFHLQIPRTWDYLSSLEAVSDRPLHFDVSDFWPFFGLATCGPCMTLSKWLLYGASKWRKWRHTTH